MEEHWGNTYLVPWVYNLFSHEQWVFIVLHAFARHQPSPWGLWLKPMLVFLWIAHRHHDKILLLFNCSSMGLQIFWRFYDFREFLLFIVPCKTYILLFQWQMSLILWSFRRCTDGAQHLRKRSGGWSAFFWDLSFLWGAIYFVGLAHSILLYMMDGVLIGILTWTGV